MFGVRSQLFPQLYDVMVKPLIDARDRYEKMKQTEESKVRLFRSPTFHLVTALRTLSSAAICPSAVCLSVCLSVTEVHWRIIANLGFKFRSKFTAHCGRGEG